MEFKNAEVLSILEKNMGPIEMARAFDELLFLEKELSKNLNKKNEEMKRLAFFGEISAGIFHEISNPLMTINGNVIRLQKSPVSDECLSFLSKIELALNKIFKITDGLKRYLYNDNDKEKMQFENLKEIIDDALIICEHKLSENKIHVELDPQIEHVQFYANYTQMFQVFVNLISNSIHAIMNLEKKSIAIRIENFPDKFRIYVEDSGKKIPKEIQENIFDIFFTTKKCGIGTGLGLALCKKIVEAHEGKIFIDENSSTTTFVIELKRP